MRHFRWNSFSLAAPDFRQLSSTNNCQYSWIPPPSHHKPPNKPQQAVFGFTLLKDQSQVSPAPLVHKLPKIWKIQDNLPWNALSLHSFHGCCRTLYLGQSSTNVTIPVYNIKSLHFQPLASQYSYWIHTNLHIDSNLEQYKQLPWQGNQNTEEKITCFKTCTFWILQTSQFASITVLFLASNPDCGVSFPGDLWNPLGDGSRQSAWTGSRSEGLERCRPILTIL